MDNVRYSGGGSSHGQDLLDKAGPTGGGSYSQGSAFYQPEEQLAPGYYGTSSGNSGESRQGGAAPVFAPSNARPGPQFVPGELLQIESTREDGNYQSETQEQGEPPRPPPPPYAFNSPPAPRALMPSRYGHFFPYNWRFITGQYPPGTYTQTSTSVDSGSNNWNTNHYIGYDYPDSPVEEQQMQSFPSDTEQSFQTSGLGYQQGPGSDMAKGRTYY